MPTVIELTDVTAQGTNATQRIEESIDILRYPHITVIVRKAVAGGSGLVLKLQHAAVLDEDAFMDVSSPSFDLATTTDEVQQFADLLRYLRWTTSGGSGTATFSVDIVAREL